MRQQCDGGSWHRSRATQKTYMTEIEKILGIVRVRKFQLYTPWTLRFPMRQRIGKDRLVAVNSNVCQIRCDSFNSVNVTVRAQILPFLKIHGCRTCLIGITAISASRVAGVKLWIASVIAIRTVRKTKGVVIITSIRLRKRVGLANLDTKSWTDGIATFFELIVSCINK